MNRQTRRAESFIHSRGGVDRGFGQCGKIKYISRRRARARAKAMAGTGRYECFGPLVAYHCWKCEAWHVGFQIQNDPEVLAEKRAFFRNRYMNGAKVGAKVGSKVIGSREDPGEPMGF
jgi:hypothetical protein